MEPAEDIDLLVTKVKAIAQGPDGGLLSKLVDLLYERQAPGEEYDDEPLSPEELAAVREAQEAIRRGDMTQFISLEKDEGEWAGNLKKQNQ